MLYKNLLKTALWHYDSNPEFEFRLGKIKSGIEMVFNLNNQENEYETRSILS
jgi:hypothetical protein